MPSFFDYVRQRVHDAILQGAQEAFEQLESQSSSLSSKVKLEALEGEQNNPAPKPVVNTKHTPTTDEKGLLRLGNSEALPPPRKRGRPRGKKKRS